MKITIEDKMRQQFNLRIEVLFQAAYYNIQNKIKVTISTFEDALLRRPSSYLNTHLQIPHSDINNCHSHEIYISCERSSSYNCRSFVTKEDRSTVHIYKR